MTDYYGISSPAEARAYLANRCWGHGSISAQGQCSRSRRHRSTSAGRANIRSGRTEHLDTAPQFCGLKHDHERLSRQVPLQTNCAAFLNAAGEPPRVSGGTHDSAPLWLAIEPNGRLVHTLCRAPNPVNRPALTLPRQRLGGHDKVPSALPGSRISETRDRQRSAELKFRIQFPPAESLRTFGS